MNTNELGKRIPLEGTINTRSLGGYLTKDNRKIKEKRVYRSDRLSFITEKDKKTIREELDIVIDIDLRGEDEIEKTPDQKIEGVTYIHCPVEKRLNSNDDFHYPHPDYNIPDSEIKGTVEFLYHLDPNANGTKAFENIYQNYVRTPFAQEHYAKLLRILGNNTKGACLFHCLDGKDRCGVGVALFLSLLGVDREDIIQDYLKTNENTKAKAEYRYHYLKDICHIDNTMLLEAVYMVAGVRRNYIEKMFEVIDSEFGGIDSYIHNQLKFTDEEIEKIKDNYLEDR